MPTLYTHRAENIRRTWLLLGAFVLIIAALGWVFSSALDSPVIVPAALGFALLTSVSSYWFSDRLVIALARAKPVAKADDPELYRIVENLSIGAGLPMPRLYLVDDPAMNAFATGRDAAHATIAVTRGLRSALERPELEGVLAHELSHIGNRDMLVATVAAVLAGMVVILVRVFLHTGSVGGGRRGRRGPEGALVAVGLLAAIILAPLAATLLRLAISRRREFLADASGALLTRHPEGLARALEKIAATPWRLRHTSDAIAHLWFSDPEVVERRASAFVNLFLTHPPVAERVRRLREMGV